MVADLIHGLRNRKLWFPCKYFTLNAASLTVITVAMKLPVDLSNPMIDPTDQWTKHGSMAFMCTMMANLLPSLATMNSKELLTNIIALDILVITLIVNVCIQLYTDVIGDPDVFFPNVKEIAYVYVALLFLLLTTPLTNKLNLQLLTFLHLLLPKTLRESTCRKKMGPKKAVAKEKGSPVTVYSVDAELLTQLSEGYPRLVSQNGELVSKNEEMTKRDKTSQGLIKLLRTENATQKDKLDLLQKEIKKLKSQMSAIQIQKSELEASNEMLISEASQLESAKSQLLQSLENLEKAYKTDKKNLESRNSSLVKQCGEEKKKCRGVESQLAEVRKRLELKNAENKHLCSEVTKLEKKLDDLGPDLLGHMENKLMLLETQLNQQKEFVLGADVEKIIDEIKKAHNEMISVMEKEHNLEKSAIRRDGENKGRILLELQKKVDDLIAENNMLSQSLQNPFAQI